MKKALFMSMIILPPLQAAVPAALEEEEEVMSIQKLMVIYNNTQTHTKVYLLRLFAH